MKQKGFYAVIVSISILCFGGGVGLAASAENQNPCAEEVKQFCGEIVPSPEGMNAMMDCLEKHEKDLSSACRGFESGMGGRQMERYESIKDRRQFRNNCIADMTKLCQEVMPTPGAMMSCLNAHTEELSDRCRQSIKDLH